MTNAHNKLSAHAARAMSHKGTDEPISVLVTVRSSATEQLLTEAIRSADGSLRRFLREARQAIICVPAGKLTALAALDDIVSVEYELDPDAEGPTPPLL
ncbi:hypothetical protein HYV74_03410 [Candidatus Uhrbacteria bacterium]|nr:hypothetical protein [Candidatus Uhrbacteria bacterium]